MVVGKNISKNLSDKFSQKSLDHAKQSTTCVSNCFKKNDSKNSKSNWCFIGNKIACKITKTLKSLETFIREGTLSM